MAQLDAADPNVCYRHPDRQSWVLCQRCGRTICPECQILAPVGVQCPECVREAGGSVKWTPTSRPATAASSMRRQPAWVRRVQGWLHPDSGAPVLSWAAIGISVLLWMVGLFTADLPTVDLAVYPGPSPFEIWRYVASGFVYPSTAWLSLVLGVLFFVLNGPSFEQLLGRRRFAAVFLASTVTGSAAAVLTNGLAYGLIGPLFGLFAAYAVMARRQGAPLTQFLVMIAINLVLNLMFGGAMLAMIVGSLLGGAGAMLLLLWNEDRGRERNAYVQLAGAAVLLVAICVIRSIVAG